MTEQFVMTEHTIVIERELQAPRELVWDAWTDPDQVTRWWGPEQFTTPRETIEFDVRPGGVFRLTMFGPDGEEYPTDGRFGIVEPPARLSFGSESIDHPMIDSSETTVEFIDLGRARTKLVITARLVCADEFVSMVEAGWTSQLDRLPAVLSG